MFDKTVIENITASIVSHLLKVASSVFSTKASFSSNFSFFVIYTDTVSIKAKLIVSKMTEIICNAL